MATPARKLDITRLRARLREVGGARPRPAPRRTRVADDGALEALVGGEDAGGCHAVTTRYPDGHRHGGLPLSELCGCDPRALATVARDPALEGLDLRRALFIDTETNGLAGGAGTYAFLVGIAYWEGDEFVIHQLFMRHPGEEPALLDALEPHLEWADSFVSFNGKSFDLPVLETRYILARRPRPLRDQPHLDLLHAARRLWKRRLASCALSTLEQEILGRERDEADVPGYLVPHLYNGYLRDGNPAPLRGVFYHNHEDLLALAALTVHMTRLCVDPERHAPAIGTDLYSLARLHEDRGEDERAEQLYQRALSTPLDRALREECLRRLSLLLKRQERWAEATALWREMLGRGTLFPYVELAKYHEHRSRRLDAATRAVRAALEAARDGTLFLTRVDRDDLAYRLARLERKQQRAEPNDA